MNVQALRRKLYDPDISNLVCNYDILMFTETWHSSIANVNIDGFVYFDCMRKNNNRKAKRESGDIVVYFKSHLSQFIQLVEKIQREYYG